MKSASLAVAALLGLSLALSAPTARADEGDPETRLWSQAEPSLRWYYSWTVGFGVATAAELGLWRQADDREARAKAGVGAATAGLAFVSTIVLPPTAGFSLSKLRAMPNGTPAEQAARRAAAKKALEKAADEQRLGTSWLAHAGGFVINLTAGLILWRGYGSFADGAQAFVGGTLISEAKIFSQPTGLVDVGLAPQGAGFSMRGSF